MDITKEINSFKRELKMINQNMKKLNQTNEKLQKLILKQDGIIRKKRNNRKISYIDWVNNERRMKNLVSP